MEFFNVKTMGVGLWGGRIRFAVMHFCSIFGAALRKFLFFRCSIAVWQKQAVCGILKLSGNFNAVCRFLIISPVQTDATLLANKSQHCWMLHVVSVCTPCCMLLDVVACCCAKFETGQTFQPTIPNISFVPWSPRHSATMLDPFAHSFSNIVGATHAHYAWITKNYGLYSSHDALQFPNLLELLHPFAHHYQHVRDNSQHCWRNNIGSCCARLHATL